MKKTSIGISLKAAMLAALGIAAICLGPSQLSAQSTTNTTLNFPVNPLFLGQTAEPNVILALDNSGSTDFEVSFTSNNGELWWNDGSSSGCGGGKITGAGFVGCAANASGDYTDTSTASTINFNYAGDYFYTYTDSRGRLQTHSSPWTGYSYVFPDGSTKTNGGRAYGDTIGFGFAIPPVLYNTFARSAYYNKSYFDPTQIYKPWIKSDGTSYPNATITAVQVDAALSSTITIDLTNDLASSNSATTNTTATPTTTTGCSSITNGSATDWGFFVLSGMTLQKGTCVLATSSSGTGVWTALTTDVKVPGTYTVNINNKKTTITVSDRSTVYIRYFPATFYQTTNTSPYTSYTGSLLPGYAPDGLTALYGYEIKPGNFSNSAEYNKAIQNFANWFTYYRKRLPALKNGLGSTFNSITTDVRVASFPINDSSGNAYSANLTMLDTSSTSDKQTFYNGFYGLTASGGTPTREAIRFIGSQYRRTDSSAPINAICQKNFGILFTDGYANVLSNPSSSPYSSVNSGNVDAVMTSPYSTRGSSGTNPYTDTVAYTMADETMYDFTGPLRSDGAYANATSVPVPAACSSSGRTASLDCNNVLHEDFYGVILNTIGFLYDGTANATTNAYTTTPSWPTTSNLTSGQNGSQVDDLWHATINGRGKLLNATSPADIANQLKSVLSSIVAQTANAGAVALNSVSLNSGTHIYSASFNSGDWRGDLYSYAINSAGTVSTTADWDAGTLLNNQSTRTILTYNPNTRVGAAFQWSSLYSSQQSLLNIDPTSSTNASDGNGQLRLNYLRGTRTQEASGASPQFRVRTNVLGDIIDSSPFYVPPPSASYTDSTYATFKSTWANRTPMIYVGANDGMLHGFEADTTSNGGKELMAYVPSLAYGVSSTTNSVTTSKPLLSKLTQSTYTHQFVVDGSPTVVDAKLTRPTAKAGWRSVLVGTMRTGGKGVFALDVTDPTAFTESTPSNTVLWEFTNADDPDLGYTFSQPAIVKMQNGKWAAIVGNGYNNTDTQGGADANVSSTNAGKAALFIIFLDGPSGTGNTWVAGTDYIKILAGTATTSTPNGLAEPAAIDVDGDGQIDFIYAGDLLGNMWRFNVNSASTSNWKTAYGGSSTGGGTPIFIAKDSTGATQPITEHPEAGYNLQKANPGSLLHPELIIFFGTGRYIDQTDSSTSNQQTQSFYGIFDHFDDVASSATAPAVTPSRGSGGNLLQQTITSQVTTANASCTGGSGCYRITSNNTLSSTNQGWYIDLVVGSASNQGERQVTTPTLRFGNIIFTTLIPSTDPCTFGGSGFLMELRGQDGSRPAQSVFDVNNNGTVDTSGTTDQITTGSSTTTVVSGLGTVVGIGSASTFLHTSNGDLDCLGGSTGNIQCVQQAPGGRYGRLSWRELIP